MTALVLDAHERVDLDPHRHADKPVERGLRWVHDPSEYGKLFGALVLDVEHYVDDSIEYPTTLARTAKTATYGYGMLDNDRYGDCMYAAIYHCQESLRLRWNIAPHEWAASTCLTAYFKGNGQRPCPPGGPGDQGSDPGRAMNFWQTSGLPGHQILGWGYLPPGSQYSKRFVAEFGAGILTLQLATQQQSQGVDFVYVPGQQCGSWGGHAIDADSFDEKGFGVVNWAELGTVDNAMEARCGSGLFIPLTTAALNQGDVGPCGTALADMKSDLARYSQGETDG
jgi:hypothetical protein